MCFRRSSPSETGGNISSSCRASQETSLRRDVGRTPPWAMAANRTSYSSSERHVSRPWGTMMRPLFRALGDLCLAGFLFLLPVFVVFQVVNRGWTSLGSVAARVARLVGTKHILGVQAETAFTGVMLVVLCVLCGWLVRFSLVSAFHDLVENTLAKYIPGYEAYKATTEGRVHKKVKVLPYTSALVMHAGF